MSNSYWTKNERGFQVCCVVNEKVNKQKWDDISCLDNIRWLSAAPRSGSYFDRPTTTYWRLRILIVNGKKWGCITVGLHARKISHNPCHHYSCPLDDDVDGFRTQPLYQTPGPPVLSCSEAVIYAILACHLAQCAVQQCNSRIAQNRFGRSE